MADGIEVVVTPVEVNVEVADPDKVGEAGATPVSVVMEDNGNLDFLMSDGRHIIAETTSPIQLAVEAANAARDEAQASASSASTSETNAANSAALANQAKEDTVQLNADTFTLREEAQASATNALEYKNDAALSRDAAQASANEASNSAEEAAASADSALEILTTTMRKITVNTDDDIPAFASLLSDYIIKVKSSERNGGFSTTYYFDFDNQSLSWIPTVGI